MFAILAVIMGVVIWAGVSWRSEPERQMHQHTGAELRRASRTLVESQLKAFLASSEGVTAAAHSLPGLTNCVAGEAAGGFANCTVSNTAPRPLKSAATSRYPFKDGSIHFTKLGLVCERASKLCGESVQATVHVECPAGKLQCFWLEGVKSTLRFDSSSWSKLAALMKLPARSTITLPIGTGVALGDLGKTKCSSATMYKQKFKPLGEEPLVVQNYGLPNAITISKPTLVNDKVKYGLACAEGHQLFGCFLATGGESFALAAYDEGFQMKGNTCSTTSPGPIFEAQGYDITAVCCQ